MFRDAIAKEIEEVMGNARNAFAIYSKTTLRARAGFMRAIARQVMLLGDELLITAGAETNLPGARLQGERGRTVFQLDAYADACERGDWLEARIDTAAPGKVPPKPDIRKMMVPLGPVVVFGASNFPFAFSTAGGDTATALAAGCPVIVKAHPAHAKTSTLVAEAIKIAVAECGLPDGVFAHVHGASFDVGAALVKHPYTKAVGFTGSYAGGKQLFDWAGQRKSPIPVFAEMSSINPVFLLPEQLKTRAEELAKQLAVSVTLGAGQFCTNPGLIIAVEGEDLTRFVKTMAAEIRLAVPATMLHEGISNHYSESKEQALAQPGVTLVAASDADPGQQQARPVIAAVTAETFLANPVLHREVFGPYSLIIKCRDLEQMTVVAEQMEGQLTATLMATDADMNNNGPLVDAVQHFCGRFILNGVPTGVEVCLSMQHGGPFPSTTDSRFTSVGADAIKRFVRPVAFQNWNNHLLPDALKNENPLGIWRTVNDVLSKEPLTS
ncbi:aldehyde dehydrogenase (NADP(+)) [Niabella drilacis]|uniref:NADP-dependent aldehyde dehydrogenase n=1 Tax=Niabella drilacis (strain DSM 25811 / CCM 8410 / CCUG 62505 / LMG 26954 / E90) TaxID=1285928 RepID=A0A1G6R8T9_NIADE|nr:aldehyde dehydrogenase (NADP(+)) [Niabella drilacis]SDD00704.1 NADP-dependent aldehyde dehydrogenase [Niabella drilacis]